MSEKYKKEIEEILARMGDLPQKPPSAPRGSAGAGPSFSRYFGRFWGAGSDLSPERLLMISLVLAIVAGIGTTFMRLPLMNYLALFSIALFVTALVLSVTGWHRPRRETRWRGQVVDLNEARYRRASSFNWEYVRWRLTHWFRRR
ncbi:MAG: hypothetical protein HY329_05755 [Chloroflexi bacterium]|nr:hypothetical protein [Chloroflexota bacterium]